MKAIILAAGYATRLYPLTLNRPKALLPIKEKPIIDYIIDQIETISQIDKIYVVTNNKFINHFSSWAAVSNRSISIEVLDDGTTTEENRLGAIGDINFVLRQKSINDDVVIIAGDNYFSFSLQNYYNFFINKNSDCICVKRIADKESLKRFGVAIIDENYRVLEMVEKPPEPKSDCAVFATYMYKKETLKLFRKYLDDGNKPDAPGNFVQWLCVREPVHAFIMDGDCYDIGTPQAYELAQTLP